MGRIEKPTILSIAVIFAEIIVFVEIPILAFLPMIEVVGFYPLLISLILSLLISAYKMKKSEKSWEVVLKVATVTPILFWLFAQIVITITAELEYRTTVNEYSQLIKKNVANEFNSSWTITVEYRNVFDGTYGRNESLPTRVLLKNSVLLGSTPLFWLYLIWFDGYEKLVVLQKKGNCGEFAIAIKTLLRDVTEMYSPKKFDFKYPRTTNGLRQTDREENKVHCKTQEKRKEQQRDSV